MSVVGSSGHIRVARRDHGQPLRLFGRRGRLGPVAVGEGAADQQHRAFRISRPAAEQAQLQMFLEVLNAGVDIDFRAHQASPHLIPL